MLFTNDARRGSPGILGRAVLVASIAISLAACSGGSAPVVTLPAAPTAAPPASGAAVASAAAPSSVATASPLPLSQNQAISIARRLAIGVSSNPTVRAVAGPFTQFDPAPKAKVSPPPPGSWVWQVTFSGAQATFASFVILDYYTGQFIESGVAQQ